MSARCPSSAAVLNSALSPTAGFLAPTTPLSAHSSSSVFVPSTTYVPGPPPASCSSSSCSSSLSLSLSTSAAPSANLPSRGFSKEKYVAVPSTTGPILEPQGEHHPWYSMKPLSEAGEFAKTQGLYFKKCKEANGGAPIYKMHPGLACIALTDHASTKWFMSQPETVLDRQDGAYFGPFKCSKNYIGDSLPPLITNMKESHAEVRAYMIEVMIERVAGTQKALTHASDNFYEHLKANGLGEHPMVYDTFLRQSYAIILEWALGSGEDGGQPLPPFQDFVNVNPIEISLLIELETDSPVANAVVEILTRLKGGGPTKEQKESVKVLLDSITSSKVWPRFKEVLEKNKVPITHPEWSFMFNTGFQSSVPMAKSMECAIAALNANPDFLKDLQDELDGQDLSMAAVGDVEKFPLLDSFHWEILRMFPAPPFYFKEAKMDLVVPTSNGDRYQIRKGDMLLCHQALGQMDELKFGPDARQFSRRRFVGNQDLKKDILAYGYPDSTDVAPKDGMPWGCVAHAIGILDSLLKVFYGRWVQEYTWEMTEPTVIDEDLFLAKAGPRGMAFSKITPRK